MAADGEEALAAEDSILDDIYSGVLLAPDAEAPSRLAVRGPIALDPKGAPKRCGL